MIIYFSKNLEIIISRELGRIFIHEIFWKIITRSMLRQWYFLAKELIFKDNNYGKKESKLSITIFQVEARKIN